MTTRLHHVLTYDATLADVAAMLADPAFREDVCRRTHTTRHDVSIEGSEAGMTVSIDQAQSASGVPSFARKFVGDEIVIVQTERWGSTTAADLHLTIPGKPGDITGGITLSPAGAGTVEVVDLTVKVSIPLVGGKIEKLVADMIEKALAKEHQVGQEWLARSSPDRALPVPSPAPTGHQRSGSARSVLVVLAAAPPDDHREEHERTEREQQDQGLLVGVQRPHVQRGRDPGVEQGHSASM